MDAKLIRDLRPTLTRFLRRFDDCFARRDTRAHLPKYVEGQLSDLARKSVEPIALKTGVPVRTLQEFLSQHEWNHGRMVDRLQAIVRSEHASPHAIGIFDETSFVKKGDQTPGVQRQYCGAVGKQENCIVTVHLNYAASNFHCLLDGELFVPESWSNDRDRCRKAGIPDDVVYRSKSDIALELYDRARANGIEFEWVTFDEWYGAKPQFLRSLDQRKQKFIGEIHKHFNAWIDPPRVTHRPHRRSGRGRGKKVPRLVARSQKVAHVEEILESHLNHQPWQRWRLKDGEKGPMVCEVKHALVHLPDENGLPSGPHHLLVWHEVLKPDEIKYFISNAPPETAVHTLLRVAFSRWRIERCFEDQKGEVGLDHYEGRRYIGLKRHLAITAVSYLFLAQTRHALAGKKSGADDLPSAHGGSRTDPRLVAEGTRTHAAHRPGRRRNQLDANEKQPSAQEPYQNHAAKTATNRHQANRHQTRSLGYDLAL
jgi:SRSO17 transposase